MAKQEEKDPLLDELKAIQAEINANVPEVAVSRLAKAVDVLLRHAIEERETSFDIDLGELIDKAPDAPT